MTAAYCIARNRARPTPYALRYALCATVQKTSLPRIKGVLLALSTPITPPSSGNLLLRSYDLLLILAVFWPISLDQRDSKRLALKSAFSDLRRFPCPLGH